MVKKSRCNLFLSVNEVGPFLDTTRSLVNNVGFCHLTGRHLSFKYGSTASDLVEFMCRLVPPREFAFFFLLPIGRGTIRSDVLSLSGKRDDSYELYIVLFVCSFFDARARLILNVS